MNNTEAAILITQTVVSAGAVGYFAWNFFELRHKHKMYVKGVEEKNQISQGICEINQSIYYERIDNLERQLKSARLACEKLSKHNSSLINQNEMLEQSVESAKSCLGVLQTRASVLESFTRIESTLAEGNETDIEDAETLYKELEKTISKKNNKGVSK